MYKRQAIDLVELYSKLGLDTILIERPPKLNPIIPTALGETAWKYEDRESGLWRVETYDRNTDLFHVADSNFHDAGLEEFERYIELLEADPINLDEYNWSQAEYITQHCKDKFLTLIHI